MGWNQVITSGSDADLSSIQTDKISGNNITLTSQRFLSTGSFSVGSNQFDLSNPLYTNPGGIGDREDYISISGEITDSRIIDGNNWIGAVYFLPPNANELDVIFDFGTNRYISEVKTYPEEIDIIFASYSIDGINFTTTYDINDNTLNWKATNTTYETYNLFTFNNTIKNVGRFWKFEFKKETSGFLNEVEFKIKTPTYVVREDFLFESGSLFVNNGDILPSADKGSNLGSSEKRFANIYAGDLELSNEDHPSGGNEVDGTTGNWTIQEGEDDLFLLNRRNGKRYKFLLQNIEE